MPFTRYLSQKPQRGALRHENSVIHPSEGRFGFIAPDVASAARQNRVLFRYVQGAAPYASTTVTQTTDNSSTIAEAATGLRFQTQATPTDNDDTAINSTATVTLTANKYYKLTARLNVSSAANYGFIMGFTTAGGTEYFTSAPADGVYFIKAKNAATVVGRTVENSTAANDTGTLATLTDDTSVDLEIEFNTNTDGNACTGFWTVNGVKTAFTANQLVDLDNMVTTTAPTLCFHLGFRVNSTTQRSATVEYCLAECER